MKAKHLKNFIFGGILAILLLTLLGNYGTFFYPFGRNLIFQVVVEILLLAYILLIIFNKSYWPNFSPIILAIIILWLVNLFALIFSINKFHSFWGDYQRMEGFFSFSHLIVFFLILIGTIKSWKDWKRIFYFIILLSVPVSLIVLFQKFFISKSFNLFEKRPYGTLDNPLFLAAYLLFPIFLTLIFLFLAQRKKERFVLASILFLLLAVFLIAFAKGGILGLGAGLLIFIIFYPSKDSIIKHQYLCNKYFKLGVLLFLLLLASTFAIKNLDYLKNPSTLSTTSYRVETWRTALLGIKEKPIFGFGQENFSIIFDKYYKGNFEKDTPAGTWNDKAHNFILEAGATTGILGILSLLVLWFLVFWKLVLLRIKTKDFEIKLFSLGLLALFSAFLAQNLTNVNSLIPSIYSFVFVGFVVFLNRQKTIKKEGALFSVKKNSLLILIGLLIITPLLVFSINKYHFDPFSANYFKNQADLLTQQFGRPEAELPHIKKDLFKKACEKYEKALEKSTFLNSDIRFNYSQALLTYANQKTTEELEAERLLKKTLDLLKENFKQRPLFVRDKQLAGRTATLLFNLGEQEMREEADNYFQQALEISPQRPYFFLDWAQNDFVAGDYKKAEEKIKKALKTEPDLAKAHWNLILSYAYQKKWFEFEQERILVKNLGWDIIDKDNKIAMERLAQLANTFLEIKEYQKLTKLYQEAIEIEPKNTQLYISLAVTYKEMNQKEKARQTINELLNILPELKNHPQIQEFLKSL